MPRLVLVARVQPQQVDVDPVRGRSSVGDELVAVLGTTRRSAAGPVIDRTGGNVSSVAVIRAIATASTGSVCPASAATSVPEPSAAAGQP